MSYIVVLMTPTPLGTFELATLLAVARLGEDAYGLAVRGDLTTRSGREHSLGAVYTTLQRLEDKGLLSSHTSSPLPVRGGRSRRLFTLTTLGATALREAEQHAAAIWSGVGTLLRPGTA
jgi:PadR family transcriptional regulator, regulatory protein PadR